MGKIDKIKEKINYLKVWLGIFVVTNIGLIGWMTGHYDKEPGLKLWLAFIATLSLSVSIALTHRNISKKIDELEDL